MGKFEKDANDLLEYVGGKENITAVSHCVTRMRFVLVDPKQANIKKIENIPSAKGTFTQSGPVSYTHLDVYKRQLWIRIDSSR